MPRARPLLLLAAAWLAAFAGLLLLDRLFPPPLPGDDPSAATIVLAADGTPLRAFADANGIWRYPVGIDEVSPLYVEALLGYEDRWFWRHGGINPLALLRASGQALWHREVVSGGSTLTMQVARLIEPQPRTLTGKLRQMLRALQLEWRLDKRQILTLYLNHAPFGGTLEGVQAASWAYLGKPAERLSHAEAALLAVLPQAPSRLRPDRHPQAARAARDKVLQRLATLGDWSRQRVDEAAAEPVVARSLVPPVSAALLAQRLRNAQPRQRRIATFIDAELQRRLEERVGGWMQRLPARTSAAVLVADTRSLEVRAYVGAGRFGDSDSFGHLDMVRAHRSPGSTLKPLLYGMALDAGLIHSASLLVDAPQTFDGYRPGNFDGRFHGPIDATGALQQSLNVPAVALLHALGPERFAARLAHVGLPLRLPAGSRPHLAMILGATEVRLEDLLGAFGALQRDGMAGRLRFTADDPMLDRRLLSPGAAWIVREMLLSAPRPGETAGRFDHRGRQPIAWKTGTSYGFRDSWALGASGGAVIGVWIGRPDGTPSPGQFGAVTALPLLFAISDSLPQSLSAAATPKPPSVDAVAVCWPLGRAADSTDPDHCHRQLDAWVLDGTVPPTLADASGAAPPQIHVLRVDADDRLLGPGCTAATERQVHIASWPQLAHPWLSASERRRSLAPARSNSCADVATAPVRALAIDGIVDGTRLRAPPRSHTIPELTLRALGASGTVSWLVNGRLEGESHADGGWRARFEEPGPQRIVAIDGNGRYGSVEIEVLPSE